MKHHDNSAKEEFLYSTDGVNWRLAGERASVPTDAFLATYDADGSIRSVVVTRSAMLILAELLGRKG